MPDSDPVQSWLKELCERNHYLEAKVLEEGRYAAIIPFMFTFAIITGRIGNNSGYEDRWCYHNAQDTKTAYDAWNGEGEPEGWHRHPATGRRRPSAEAELEYINP